MVTGNKENNKKTSESSNSVAVNGGGAKVALKPREFGREITNATAATSNTGTQATKHNSSLIID